MNLPIRSLRQQLETIFDNLLLLRERRLIVKSGHPGLSIVVDLNKKTRCRTSIVSNTRIAPRTIQGPAAYDKNGLDHRGGGARLARLEVCVGELFVIRKSQS